jgi:general L-amino acid transport system permease protein
LWRNATARSILYQFAVVGGIVWLFYIAISNALSNLRQRGVSTGFAFLRNEAGISIPEAPPIPADARWLVLLVLVLLLCLGATAVSSRLLGKDVHKHVKRALLIAFLIIVAVTFFKTEWIRYSPSDSYYLILLTGMANSIRIGVVAAGGAVVLGFVLGICQLSTNWLLRHLVQVVTETARNIPMLLHVLFWYTLILNTLPPVRGSLSVGGIVFLSNRGIFYPTIVALDFNTIRIWALPWIGILVFLLLRKASLPVLVLVGTLGLLACLGLSSTWDVPAFRGFNFAGGATLTPEYTALLVGLVVYYSAFIADIVRSGIRAIPVGQWEAARSIGLTRLRTIRLVIVPQAMRIIVPPLSNQLLGLAKDTSIGVAVAYPDFVAISRTVINQTGQALEVMFLVMSFYLVVNLAISSALNIYNRRVRISEP